MMQKKQGTGEMGSEENLPVVDADAVLAGQKLFVVVEQGWDWDGSIDWSSTSSKSHCVIDV